MEGRKTDPACRIPSQKRYLREQKKYRKSIWGSLFLEILLEKMWEKELRLMLAPEEAETAVLSEKDSMGRTGMIHTAGKLSSAASLKLIGMGRNLELLADTVLTAKEDMGIPEYETALSLQAADDRLDAASDPAGLFMDMEWKASAFDPWKLEDCLELSNQKNDFGYDLPAASENYNRIAGILRYAALLCKNEMLKEVCGVIKAYYAGEIEKARAGEIFRDYCVERLNQAWDEDAGEEKALLEMYEYFSRVNAREAVGRNNREGKRFVEESGLSWAGTTYYNSAYYYIWADMQKLFRNICTELTEQFGLLAADYKFLENNTRFAPEGGLSFQGVFEWVQMQNNFPCDKYGFRRKEMKPPKNFIYLYRNGYCRQEAGRLANLKERLSVLRAEDKEHGQRWRMYAGEGGAYTNGRSRLLCLYQDMETDRRSYRYAMEFLENFKLFRISGCAEILYAQGPD